jgi:hypothetical protein
MLLKKNRKTVLGPGYLGSVLFCGAAKWVKLSDSWKKSKFVDIHKMLKTLHEGQQEGSKVIKI